MSSATSKEPSYYKNEINEEEIKKLEKILDTMEKDNQTFEFLILLTGKAYRFWIIQKLLHIQWILVQLKKKLLNGEYKKFRTYNIPGSDIVKMTNQCDKKINN